MARSHAPLLGPGQPIELPRAARSAAPFAALALLASMLLLVPAVPAAAAAVAVAAFSLAAVARAADQHRALVHLQASVDEILLRQEPIHLSPILVWRAGQLCSLESREQIAASLRRIARSAHPSHLAGASPLNRVAIRAHASEIDAVIDRLDGPEPVGVRGVLLARRLLDDPAGPLYGNAASDELGAALRRIRSSLREAEQGS
jgi:hypothetical protein